MQPITDAAKELMARQVTTLAALKGETIERLKFQGRFNREYVLLDFESGHWALLRFDQDGDDGVDGEVVSSDGFDMVQMAVLYYAGYVTRELHDAEYEEQRKQSSIESRERELERGRELIAKYPELRAEPIDAPASTVLT